MGKRKGIEVSLAVAEAVKMAKVDVVAAYPITPQTHIVEGLAEIIAEGHLDAEYICVESEHSAMSACLGSSAVGARTFTSTSGQGMELMHEVVYVASSMRLPIVMVVANRSLSGPLSVWGDHSDVMAVRDTGWIQVFAEDGQEAFDLTLWAFRCAEDHRVLFPVMVNLDGFHLTHVVEPIEIPEQELAGKFLPKCELPITLDPRKPVTMGAFTIPQYYTEVRKSQEEALWNTMPVIRETLDEFAKVFGRKYNFVEKYKTEDADTLFLTMGSYSQTASLAIDELRKQGVKVGQLKLRLWRPFPFDEIREAVKGAKRLIVLDRAISLAGAGGPVAPEIRSALYGIPNAPKLSAFIAGLGGRDILPDQFVEIIKRGIVLADEGQKGQYEMYGVRE